MSYDSVTSIANAVRPGLAGAEGRKVVVLEIGNSSLRDSAGHIVREFSATFAGTLDQVLDQACVYAKKVASGYCKSSLWSGPDGFIAKIRSTFVNPANDRLIWYPYVRIFEPPQALVASMAQAGAPLTRSSPNREAFTAEITGPLETMIFDWIALSGLPAHRFMSVVNHTAVMQVDEQ